MENLIYLIGGILTIIGVVVFLIYVTINDSDDISATRPQK
jgi:hypothetical protein